MHNKIFCPATFEEARSLVVCECNGYSMDQRWEEESPLFAQAILEHLPASGLTLLDYGCGVGRIARQILKQRPDTSIIGLDDSRDQLSLAKIYVNNPNFKPVLPAQLNEAVDLAYSIYALQHIPAIELRDALARIHYFLKPDGVLCDCSTYWRLAVRFDSRAFFDDRILGVDLEAEILRFFEPIGPLFSEQIMTNHEIIRRMVKGESLKPGDKGVPHRAMTYRKKAIEGQYFQVPSAKAG